ncbi:hypothetical protein TNCV_3506661 [Trichonephila clavipes]|uniref:Uncharacterized protein n=1 Tax=Trichonephila clavipes TaxID=2585209 RepID=A0A8X6RY11_TRICX|nr:hypothetical protein TNCV_3506661 [Trichonephila clavipes]
MVWTISLEEFLINGSILQGSKDLRLSNLIEKSEKNSIWIIPPWSSFRSPSFQKNHQRTPVSNWNCCSHVPKKKTLTAAKQKKILYPASCILQWIPAHVNIEVTEFDSPRIIASTIARLKTEHLKGMKIHPDKTRSNVQFKHCPDLQLTPNHILECPTVATKLLKMGMVPQRDSLRELLYSPDAPRIAEAVIKTFDGI